MKSSITGNSSLLTRSDKNITAPFSIPTTSKSLPLYSSEISFANWSTLLSISSSVRRISLIGSFKSSSSQSIFLLCNSLNCNYNNSPCCRFNPIFSVRCIPWNPYYTLLVRNYWNFYSFLPGNLFVDEQVLNLLCTFHPHGLDPVPIHSLP